MPNLQYLLGKFNLHYNNTNTYLSDLHEVGPLLVSINHHNKTLFCVSILGIIELKFTQSNFCDKQILNFCVDNYFRNFVPKWDLQIEQFLHFSQNKNSKSFFNGMLDFLGFNKIQIKSSLSSNECLHDRLCTIILSNINLYRNIKFVRIFHSYAEEIENFILRDFVQVESNESGLEYSKFEDIILENEETSLEDKNFENKLVKKEIFYNEKILEDFNLLKKEIFYNEKILEDFNLVQKEIFYNEKILEDFNLKYEKAETDIDCRNKTNCNETVKNEINNDNVVKNEIKCNDNNILLNSNIDNSSNTKKYYFVILEFIQTESDLLKYLKDFRFSKKEIEIFYNNLSIFLDKLRNLEKIVNLHSEFIDNIVHNERVNITNLDSENLNITKSENENSDILKLDNEKLDSKILNIIKSKNEIFDDTKLENENSYILNIENPSTFNLEIDNSHTTNLSNKNSHITNFNIKKSSKTHILYNIINIWIHILNTSYTYFNSYLSIIPLQTTIPVDLYTYILQNITRYPLYIEKVLSYLDTSSINYKILSNLLTKFNKFIKLIDREHDLFYKKLKTSELCIKFNLCDIQGLYVDEITFLNSKLILIDKYILLVNYNKNINTKYTLDNINIKTTKFNICNITEVDIHEKGELLFYMITKKKLNLPCYYKYETMNIYIIKCSSKKIRDRFVINYRTMKNGCRNKFIKNNLYMKNEINKLVEISNHVHFKINEEIFCVPEIDKNKAEWILMKCNFLLNEIVKLNKNNEYI